MNTIPPKTPYTTSIAVLPFVNMSADPDNEYFSDGITEEIINALTKVNGLKVIARTSSFAFKGSQVDVRTIARQLGVASILEGSVRKARQRVRITAQLIDARDGTHLWSKNFDRELQDIFALQDEISLLIADRIRENFGHLNINEQLVEQPDLPVSLYQHYLKARFFLNKFNTSDIRQGMQLLREILEQQPDFALAHVGLHYGYNIMAAGGLMPMQEVLTIGRQHLDRALQLNETLPEAYHSLGWHALNYNWDFNSATNYLLRAIRLRPGYADAHQKLFINLALEGKLDAALQHIQTALQLDPLSALNNYFMAYYYYLTDDSGQANHFFEKTFQLEPAFIVGYSIYALAQVRQNRPDRILAKANTIPDIDGADTERLMMHTLAYCQQQNIHKAEAGLQRLREKMKGERRERIRFFMIYMETLLDRPDAALDLIEQGIPQKEPLLTLVKVDPILQTLSSNLRFQEVLTTIYALSDTQQVEQQDQSGSTAPLSAEEIALFTQKLHNCIQEEEPFLDPGLSLRELAEKIALHPNKLSWLLNEHIGKNFNEYINSYRLDTFKKKALDPANSHLTLLGLAYDSGFNSKTVFNSFFKKTENSTPRAWVKANRSHT